MTQAGTYSLDHVLGQLQGVRSNGRGHTALCPAHEDHNNSLSVKLAGDGRVLLHCFAGCSFDKVIGGLGLDPKDLHPDTEQAGRLTVSALADDKLLPVKFLRLLGLEDRADGVLIPYRLRNGSQASRQRLRTALQAKHGSRWLKGTGKPVPYGLERLDQAARAGFLVLVEGESDCWTLWHHGFPALGMPGASMAGKLESDHLRGIEKLCIFREPDTGGDNFVPSVRSRLRQFGWAGEALELCIAGIKDPNDLHRKDPEGFKVAFQAAIDQSKPPLMETPVIETTSPLPSWPRPADAVFHGVIGEFVRLVDPHTEADPMAILIQTLAAFGNVIGRNAHFCIEADRHYVNIFLVLVGATSKGRKGTSWGHVSTRFAALDETWARDRVQSGLSSGEGLIWAVHDPIVKQEPIKEKKRVVGYQEIVADPGIEDKRLFVFQPEFASVLKVLGREGNTLSALVRQAWDTGDLRALTKNSPAKSTGAHISIVCHITKDELRRYLTTTESGNGFANRFLWICTRRSKVLPEGGNIHTVDFSSIHRRLAEAIEFGRTAGTLAWNDEAREAWRAVYPKLSEGLPGLLGAVTSRSEAQVLRLASLYALLDQTVTIRREHLLAALALWEYAEESARHIFGDSLGDPVADEILQTLKNQPDGLTLTEIRDLFGRNRSRSHIAPALNLLSEHGLAYSTQEKTGGRPAERWRAIEHRPRGES